MKKVARLLVLCAVLAVVVLSPFPQAGACCTPCSAACQPGVPPSTPCCTGIPVPGNACGLTTCGKWWTGSRTVADAAFAGF
jgi:hypothetical protein